MRAAVWRKRRPGHERYLFAIKAIHFCMAAAAVAASTGALVPSFLAVLDAGSVTAAAQRSARAADGQPARRRARAQLGAPLVPAHRPRRRADRGGARHRRRARRMEDAALASGAVCRRALATRGVVRVDQPGRRDLAAAGGAGPAAARASRDRGRAGRLERAHQPASPRSRHRGAHGAAGAVVADRAGSSARSRSSPPRTRLSRQGAALRRRTTSPRIA